VIVEEATAAESPRAFYLREVLSRGWCCAADVGFSLTEARRHGGQVLRADASCGKAEKKERRKQRRKEGRKEGRKEERRRRKTYFFPCSFLLLFPQMHPVLRAGDARLPLIYLRASVPP
jgi:hypothetical protein